jgi:predicted ribosomally synthesized peptide with nif11-like leader
MSTIAEFYEALSADEAMQERAKALGCADETSKEDAAEAIIAFAEGEGYTFSAEELQDFVDSKELSADELEAVAAGRGGCFVIGVSWANDGKTCVCVIGGASYNSHAPKSERWDGTVCVLAGFTDVTLESAK